MENSILFTSLLRMPTRYGEFTINHIEFLTSDLQRSFHQHKNFEILYVLSGSIELTIGKNCLLLLPNNAIIIKPDTMHEIIPNKSSEVFLLHFDTILTNLTKSNDSEKSLFARLHYALSDDKKQLIILDTSSAYQALENIKKELLENNWGYKLLVGNQCSNFLYLTLRNLPAKFFSGKDLYDLPANENLAVKIYSYLVAHIEESPSLEEVANIFHISTRQVNRLLTNFYNQSFVVILNSVRLSKAKELITTTDLSFEEIASKVGYDSHKSLYNLFKKYEKISPSEYRNGLRL